MRSPWNIPCDANTLRGQLKHSWLENEVLNISIETVIALWQQGAVDRAVKYSARIADLDRLADSFVDGFSPTQLVNTLQPFGGLSIDEKTAIKSAVHEAYLETSGILALQAPLNAAAQDMKSALDELSKAWALPYLTGEETVRRTWENVREKAWLLIVQLERLPKGIVLP